MNKRFKQTGKNLPAADPLVLFSAHEVVAILRGCVGVPGNQRTQVTLREIDSTSSD